MEYKDYYAALGVAKTASEDEIKKAYRKLVRKYHPDISKEPDADARTKELNEAYGVLSDPEKRAAYDELGQGGYRAGQEFRPPPDWGSSFEGDPSDFFADLFAHVGGRRRGGGGGGHTFRMRGDDSHATLQIDLQDTYNGAQRTLNLRVPELDGQGRVVTREKTLNVNIPKGVTSGQQLRLSGQGQPGADGGEAGDLYLELSFSDSAVYRVEGRDVYENVPVTPWEAMLGGEIDVITPSGRVTVTVPAKSQSGRKLRLKGRGIPAPANGGTAGDLYLIMEVVLPPADTDKARELYQQMAREMPFNPRG